MAKFSLQRVLELKRRREQAVAIRLADARTRVEAARMAVAAIETLREESEAQWHAGSSAVRTVGSMQNASYVRDQLEQQLAEARTAVRTVEAEVDACLAEFTIALQERQVLDRLKEKRMLAAHHDENRVEQATTDAVALTHFVRRDTAATGARS